MAHRPAVPRDDATERQQRRPFATLGVHPPVLTVNGNEDNQSPSGAQPSPGGAILRHMKVEEIAEAIAKLPQDQLARFRRWFTAFEAGRSDHAEELELHGDQTWPPRRPRVC